MKMTIDVDSTAALLLELYPTATLESALYQARLHLDEGCMSAAAAWARAAAMLSDTQAMIAAATQIVA